MVRSKKKKINEIGRDTKLLDYTNIEDLRRRFKAEIAGDGYC